MGAPGKIAFGPKRLRDWLDALRETLLRWRPVAGGGLVSRESDSGTMLSLDEPRLNELIDARLGESGGGSGGGGLPEGYAEIALAVCDPDTGREKIVYVLGRE